MIRANTLLVLGLLASPAALASDSPAWQGSALPTLAPKDALFFAVTAPPAVLAERLGWAPIVKKYRKLFAEFAAQTKLVVGADLTSITGWSAIGFDPSKPAAVAWLGGEADAAVLWLAVGDRAALVSALRKSGQGVEPDERAAGAASILTTRELPFRVILRDGYAGILIGNRGDGEALDALATQLGALPAEDALSGDPRFKAHLAVDGGRDVAAWLDLRGLAEMELAADARRRGEHEQNWAEGELERATKEGAAPDRIRDLEEQVKNDRDYRKRQEERDARTEKLVRSFTDSIESIGLGLTIEGHALELRGRVALAEGDRVRSILRNDASMRLTGALTQAPMLLMEGRYDPVAATALLRDMIDADSTEGIAGAEKYLLETFGLNLSKDFLDALGDETGFAMTIIQGADSRTTMGGTLAVKLRDPATASTTLGTIAGHERTSGALEKAPEVAGFKTRIWDDAWAYLTVSAGYFVGTTTPAVVDRVSKGVRSGFLGKGANPGLRATLESPGASAIWVMDMGRVIFEAARNGRWADTSRASEIAETSPKVVALRKKIAAIETKLQKAADKRRVTREKEAIALGRVVGASAFSVRVGPEGLTVRGGQYPGGKTLVSSLDTVIGAAMAITTLREADERESQKARAEIEALEEQIRAIEQ